MFGQGGDGAQPAPARATDQPGEAAAPALEIAPNDPLIPHLQRASGAVDVDDLDLDSPALRAMEAAGVGLVVPLVSQGEVIGILNLGPRRSRQEYSDDDRALLNSLAAQAAPAMRVAQMAREQQAEARAREGIEQELRVARLIQQTLLPKTVPELPGWRLAAYYRPARAVGGDFYDFLDLADGRLGLVIGDVTSKGVPAALVMATTRSVLRATVLQLPSPGLVLGRANELLCPDMPPHMFVTCFYAVLESATGRLAYANAGHPLPFRRRDDGVDELRATGMPLGLMSDARYEEREIHLIPGERVLFY
ncbi:MAG: SpoIIE family protein phosphatase, partial [Actinomycetota bacterium]|nr:SpoIIE family protein phosphatase [Actinomycetota bacterium]